MPKKFLISTLIVTSSLAGAGFLAPPANAEKITINNTDYWTLDIVAEKAQKYTEDLKMCEGNRECEEYLETAYILAENEYSAGQAFSDNYFAITAINPAESTIRVVFHDEANRRMMMPGDGEKDVMQNLFLYWWNGDQSRWIYAFDGPEYEINRQDIFVHLGAPGEEWLEPNKEVELKVPDFDFSILKTSRIFFYARSEKGNASGDRDITTCMNAIENLDGYECQAVFDWLGNISYQPLKAKISTSSIEVPAGPAVDNGLGEGAKAEISTNVMRVPEIRTEVVATSGDTTSEDAFANTPEITSENSLEATSDAIISTSDTVEVPLAAGKKEEHQFPWWLVVFTFSGIFLILWWFVPIRHRKDQEN